MSIYQRKFNKVSSSSKVKVEKINVENYKDRGIKKILLPSRGLLATETIISGCDLAKQLGAELTVLHIVVLPFLLPLSSSLFQSEMYSESILNRAVAIGEDKKVKVIPKTIKARSVVKAILETAEKGDVDLIIVGSKNSQTLGPTTKKILQKAKCRVWVISPTKKKLLKEEQV